jgi:hypothetical protein
MTRKSLLTARRIRRGAGAASAVALTAVTLPYSATADRIFVQCDFSVHRPFHYDIGGSQYVGARMNADNCKTNLPSAQITLAVTFQVGYGSQSGPTDISRHEYSAPVDVQNGGSYSVQFPNNDDQIPLKPGSFTFSGSAASTIEGFVHPKEIDTAIATWGVSWGTLPKMS